MNPKSGICVYLSGKVGKDILKELKAKYPYKALPYAPSVAAVIAAEKQAAEKTHQFEIDRPSDDAKIHFRDGRSGFQRGQGFERGEPRDLARSARFESRADEVRSLHQRRSGNDVSASARRSLCD